MSTDATVQKKIKLPSLRERICIGVVHSARCKEMKIRSKNCRSENQYVIELCVRLSDRSPLDLRTNCAPASSSFGAAAAAAGSGVALASGSSAEGGRTPPMELLLLCMLCFGMWFSYFECLYIPNGQLKLEIY